MTDRTVETTSSHGVTHYTLLDEHDQVIIRTSSRTIVENVIRSGVSRIELAQRQNEHD